MSKLVENIERLQDLAIKKNDKFLIEATGQLLEIAGADIYEICDN